jgi:hypothetical protein
LLGTATPPPLYNGRTMAVRRRVKVVLVHAHLNHQAGDDRTENVALLRQWCHNNHNAMSRARHAAETRKDRKDAGRPILAAALEKAGAARAPAVLGKTPAGLATSGR